ncbi:MAG: efflux RND transporter periplasmic adaptor subunit [Rubrivivax sp.]|uniref:efflux RND transporter periplasmic adaptor subunit n=1 Tax=Ottowia sp. TaxID=1898956 RepID=UPI0011D31C9A|nr:efflux RND transporter periplasmic adaptor subunit [Ottowia sp.]MCC6814258.1 efflux RND transporter periplasmic adaptor subunit [Rubrivivax sp.]MCZ2089557.1 efflux RND transporter periplasmic adaptor subunit [Burkholderiales bacterium]TXI17465.1 MAG: efflux RND transporter periplasmic adaptor subunit [Ottowia sp.]HNR83719.1 efflux RND transporter periplasmic adaptor subunit [Ottowia sp.]HNT84974.1 efflux RND transporter periplasmic adaptor subunit [Ottowia sp.]
MTTTVDTPAGSPAATPTADAAPRRRGLGVTLTLLLIAALVGSAWWLVQRARAPEAAAPAAAPGGAGGPGPGSASVTVGAAHAQRGELPIVIDALGTVTPPVTATLVPQVSGVLTEVLFTEGQMVSKGQVLARIDARPYEQALAQARGQRAKDEAQLAAARVTLARYQTLWQQDSIARQDVDTQAALVKQLEGVVEADRASERAAQLNVGFASIRAPIGGRIGLRAIDPGNLVSTGSAGGIATITQIAPIDVVFSVPQDRIAAVLAAQRRGRLPVQAFDRARSQPLAEGSFLTLDNQVSTATGTVRAKARFANADGALFPNQFVNARLQLGHDSGVLVPVTAVRTGPQGDYVYVIDDERVARMRPVRRGMATVDQVLIVQGLQAGERVVTEGGDRVKDGGKLRLAGESPGPGGAAGMRPGAAPAPAPTAPAAIASGAGEAGAAAPPWLERLPPELRDKVRAMSPEERRAFLQQRRAAASAADSGR